MIKFVYLLDMKSFYYIMNLALKISQFPQMSNLVYMEKIDLEIK